MPGSKVRGYVLAGGQSSRMGQDKAAAMLGGRSLMEWAVGTLQEVCGDDVAALGPERSCGGARLRWVADRRPGMGPLAGLEAAIEDAAATGVDRVLMVPVDVPLLPGGLLRMMVERWMGAGCRVGYPEVNGQAQPAITLVRTEILPAVREALDAGLLRLREVLERAAGDQLCVERLKLWEGRVVTGTDESKLPWTPGEREWELRTEWFANVNAPADLQRLEQMLRA